MVLCPDARSILETLVLEGFGDILDSRARRAAKWYWVAFSDVIDCQHWLSTGVLESTVPEPVKMFIESFPGFPQSWGVSSRF